MQENKTKTIVTVGNGIAIWCLHYYLRNSGLKVINISADDFFTPCSHSSTAINCLRGTTPGNSPLGDTIISSMEEFYTFLRAEKPQGINTGHEYQILEAQTIPKWERRYPDFYNVKDSELLSPLIRDKNLFHKVPAHFIDVVKLEKWLKDKGPEVQAIRDLVLGIENKDQGYIVKTRNDNIYADQVVLGTGHSTQLLLDDTSEKFRYYIDHSKPVTGGYLELNGAKELGFYFEESFVLAIEKYHFIYRKEENLIQIGSSSRNNDALELPLVDMLKEIYEYIDKYTKFDLPAFSDFEFKTGIRHKGHLRRPFWGSIDDKGLYAICGLYKNAFSFSFEAASDISSQISSR